MTRSALHLAPLSWFVVCFALALLWLPTTAEAQDVELLQEFLSSNGRRVDVVGLNDVESVDVLEYEVMIALAPLPDPNILPNYAAAHERGLFTVYTDEAPGRPPVVQVAADATIASDAVEFDPSQWPKLPASVGFRNEVLPPLDGMEAFAGFRWTDGPLYMVSYFPVTDSGEPIVSGSAILIAANADLFSAQSLLWPQNRWMVWNFFAPDSPILIVVEFDPDAEASPWTPIFDRRWRVVLLHILLVWLLGIAWLGIRVTPPLSPQTSVARYRVEHASALADHLARSRSGVAAARVLIRWSMDRLRERTDAGSPMDDNSLAIELARRSGLPVDVIRARIARAEVVAAGTDDMKDAPELAIQLIALLRNRGDRK